MNKSVLGFVILSLSTTVNATIKEETEEKVNSYHNGISEYIHDGTEYVDEKIGEYDDTDPKVNNTYGLLRIKQNFNSLYTNENQIDFKFKAHLPYTEERWNFFIDTNSSDFNSLEEKIKENFTDNSIFADNTKSSIIGFIFDDTEHKWKRSYKFGVKFDFPLDPFVKFNIYNTKKITNNIDQYFEQEFFAYTQKGLGAKSDLKYSYTTEENKIYQSNTSFQYLANDENELEASQQFTQWQRISSKGTLKHSIGFSAIWTDERIDNSYWINTRYRHQLYDDWLYGKVIPEVSFKKEYDYKPNYGIMFELEIFFAKAETLQNITNDY